MYKPSELKKLLFFDIETSPAVKYSDLSEGIKKIWIEKYHYKFFEQELLYRKKKQAIEMEYIDVDFVDMDKVLHPTWEQIYNKYCPLIPEFGKVWCVSFGAVNLKGDIEINTIQNDDEKQLIVDFLKVLDHYDSYNLCGYNISDFDIPYLLKRIWVNKINTYPIQLQLKDAKPWTTKHVDVMLDWMNISREKVSLGLLCEILGIKTPKDKFNNDEFTTLLLEGKITTEEGVEYCEKDVKALYEVCVALSSENNFGVETTSKWKK